MAKHSIRFFHDFASPFSYFAATQIEAFCEPYDVDLVWHPMLLGGVFKSIGAPIVPLEKFTPAKLRHANLDMARHATLYDVPFAFPTRFPMRTIAALRMVLAQERADATAVPALTRRIYRAYWGEDRDINEPEVLTAMADEVGLDGEGLLTQTKDPEIKQRLFDNTDAAVQAGVFGAPSFVVDDEHLFWGQDRLSLLAALILEKE